MLSNLEASTINHQPTVNHQPPSINYQSSITNQPSTTINHQPAINNHRHFPSLDRVSKAVCVTKRRASMCSFPVSCGSEPRVYPGPVGSKFTRGYSQVSEFLSPFWGIIDEAVYEPILTYDIDHNRSPILLKYDTVCSPIFHQNNYLFNHSRQLIAAIWPNNDRRSNFCANYRHERWRGWRMQ